MGVQRLAVPDRLAFPPRTTRGARRLGQKVEIAVLGFGGYRPPFPEPASSRRNRDCSARSLHVEAFFKPAVSGKGFCLVVNGTGTGTGGGLLFEGSTDLSVGVRFPQRIGVGRV